MTCENTRECSCQIRDNKEIPELHQPLSHATQHQPSISEVQEPFRNQAQTPKHEEEREFI